MTALPVRTVGNLAVTCGQEVRIMLALGRVALLPDPATNQYKNDSHSDGGASSQLSSQKQTFLPRMLIMASAVLTLFPSL